MKRLVCIALLASLSVPCFADSQKSYGTCSPNILNNRGNQTIVCNITQYIAGGRTKELKFVSAILPSNNAHYYYYYYDGTEQKKGNVKATQDVMDFFDRLQELDGEIVYLRLGTYVSAGPVLHDVPYNWPVRAGVTLDIFGDSGQCFEECKQNFGDSLDCLAECYLGDGFGGNRAEYKDGYAVILKELRNKWQRSRWSTILFPISGNAFFDVHYSKAFALDGLAKIRITAMQGAQWIEIVPAQPFGDLLEKYYAIHDKLPKKWFHEF